MEKKTFRIAFMLIGCLMIAICINLFLIPNEIVMFGTNGIAMEMFYLSGIAPALNILILNLIILLFSTLVLGLNKVRGFITSSLAVPLFVYFTRNISSYIHIGIDEKLIIVIASAFVLGYGYSLLYKHGYAAGTIFLLEDTIGEITHIHSKYYSWVIDACTIAGVGITMGFMNAVYSFILIIFAKEMITRARFGINDSKMFYVITSKEKEVKELIMHHIKSNISVLDVKGGFTKKANRIIISVINSSDYYRLKEGIKAIDPKAFIVITDTYDVINRKTY